MPDSAAISYTPRILRNMGEICEAMGVGEKMIKSWIRRGAPIAVEAGGSRTRYSAEAASLQHWRLSRRDEPEI